MTTPIDQGAGASARAQAGQAYVASMQAIVSAGGAQFDLVEIMRLYTVSGAAGGAPETGKTPPRVGVPQLTAPAMSMDDAALMIGQLQSKLMDLMTQQQTGEIKSGQIDMKQRNADQTALMARSEKPFECIADPVKKTAPARCRCCFGCRCTG